MSDYKILVVDDEKDAAEVAVMRLKKFGMYAEAVNSGKSALDYCKKNKPDIIVLDLLMPEMDGYEVARKLREDSSTADIPILMLTVESSREDKLRALKMGIDDYIIKPYDVEELAARIDVILKRALPHEETGEVQAKGVTLKDKKRIEFLKHLQDKHIQRIDPEYDMASRNGYCYKSAAEFCGTDHNCSEMSELKYLADNHILKHEFFDKIMVCPYCFHHDINIRETNPADHSPNISVCDAFHHYRCGYVGAEDEFLQGIKYVCPKCFKELAHIGVDYDRPGKVYISNVSGEKFIEPDVFCQCRNCKKTFEIDDVVRQDIFSFLVTDRAAEAVTRGSFEKIDLEQELTDQDVGVYNLRYFRNKLDEEVVRSKTFKRHMSIIMVSLNNFDKLLQSKGEAAMKKILKEFALVLKENLWSVDTPARYDKNDFITLIPESDKKRAKEIVKTLKEKVAEGLDVSFRIVSYPEDADTSEKLLEKLIKSGPVKI